jgi:hypothetical protein
MPGKGKCKKQESFKRLRKYLGFDQPAPLTVTFAFLPFPFPGVRGGECVVGESFENHRKI